MKAIKSLLVFIPLLISWNVSATVHTVGLVGPPTYDYASIQAAINIATAGDTIEVSAGTYTHLTEGVPSGNQGLINVTTGVSIIAATGVRPIIDGTGVVGVFKIHPSALSPGNTVRIEGLKITGDASTGIAITMQSCFDGIPAEVVIHDNEITGMIGGINFWGANNFLPAGWTSGVANVTISDNNINNLGVAGTQFGFGIYIEGAIDWVSAGNDHAVKITNNEFGSIYSDPSNYGAGIGMAGSYANVHVDSNHFIETPIGVSVLSGDVSHTRISYNQFIRLANDIYSVFSVPAAIVNSPIDASLNYWGSLQPDFNTINVGDITVCDYFKGAMSNLSCPPVSNLTDGKVYYSIQDAIDGANAGDMIEVAAGTYDEDLDIHTSVTLNAASGGAKPLITGTQTVNADDVTIDGFELTNPDGQYAITMSGKNRLEILNNYIHNVGINNLAGAGDIVSVNILNAGTGVNIDSNDIMPKRYQPENFEACIKVDGASGIVQILNNTLEMDYDVGYSTGAALNYNGIYLLNGAAGNISGNGIIFKRYQPENFEACIKVAGLGSPSEIYNNNIEDGDIGILITNDATAIIESNSITAAGTNTDYEFGVKNETTSLITATCNWWGSSDAAVVAAAVLGDVQFLPYLVPDAGGSTYPWSGTDKYSCDGYGPVVVYEGTTTTVRSTHVTIQAAIDDASAGDVIEVAAGTYDEDLDIHTSVTLNAASGGAKPLITGTQTVNADDVTIDGFELTNPDGQYAITMSGKNRLEILNNYIHNVGINNLAGTGDIVSVNILNAGTGVNIDGNDIMPKRYQPENFEACIKVDGASGIVQILNNTLEMDYDVGYSTGAASNYNGIYLLNGAAGNISGNGIIFKRYQPENFEACIKVAGLGSPSEIYNNNIEDGDIGILITNDAEAIIEFNSITAAGTNTDYEFGVKNETTSLITATNNWWGDASGPYHVTTNSSATGKAVSDDISYNPWLGSDPFVPGPVTYIVADGGSVQDAIDNASNGDTIKVRSGTYSEVILVNEEVILAPGASPGCVTSIGLTMGASSTLQIEIDGTTNDCSGTVQYDRMIVNGAVSIDPSANLSLVNAGNNTYTGTIRIIDNDGTDPISGTFSGDPAYSDGTNNWLISYDGGDGNDVVLTVDNTAPVMDSVSPAEGNICLAGGENFILTVDASDDNLYSLEIDHSLQGTLPEFTVYADATDPTGGQQAAYTTAGVGVTYDATDQVWEIDFGTAITNQFVSNGGITFYMVLEDCAGNEWGTMNGTDDTNTWVYTMIRDDVAPVMESVSPAEGNICLAGGENFILTVDASDDNLYSLEIDHSLQGTLPEFTVYADATDPTGGQQAAYTTAGVGVTYDATDQVWEIDFGTAITNQFVSNGGITFYMVLEDCAGNEWGTMNGTDDTNTWVYTMIRDDVAPVMESVSPAEGNICLAGGENFILTVDASDDNLYSLEIDHSLQGTLPEFTVYADATDPTGGQQAAYTTAGVGVTYDATDQVWEIDFGTAITNQFVSNGGITFYMVLEDCAGNEWGTMNGTDDTNTWVYTMIRDDVAPVMESVSPAEGNICLAGGENFILTVDASDDNLYSLEIDHSLQGTLPEFTVYADATDPTGGQQAAYTTAGVGVTYDATDQVWEIDFGTAITNQFVSNGGITFYMVLEDCAGNEWGTMNGTDDTNTWVYTMIRDDVAPVMESVSPAEGNICLAGGENFILTVDASDDNLYSLEIDHSLQGTLPEFTVYADATDPTGGQQAAYTAAGVGVTYDATDQVWEIDFGTAITNQFVSNGGITFYMVLEDCAGNEWGTMNGTDDTNTWVYTMIRDDVAPVMESVSPAEGNICLAGGENFILTVDASDDNLYSLEIDHSLQGTLPEFTVYADATDPTGGQQAAYTTAGVGVTYDATDQVWEIDFGTAITNQFVSNGGITFYMVLEDCAGNEWGTMNGTDDTNTWVYTMIRDDVAPVMESVSPAEGNICLAGGENFILTVDASDDNLYSLEIDHSLQGTLPEFTVYADATDPTGGQQAAYTTAGVGVTYDATDQVWEIDFGTAITNQFVSNGGITFYMVLEDCAGNEWGTMNGTADSNTWVYQVNLEPEVTDVTLEVSTDQSSWSSVNGDFDNGFQQCLDPAYTWYYLDINTLTSSEVLETSDFTQNAFYLNTSSLSSDFYDYWDTERNVNASSSGGWEAIMWQIINGNQPMFYLDFDGSDYTLVDGLQYLAGNGAQTLRLNGDYPEGTYTFEGTVEDENGCTSQTIAIEITFNPVPDVFFEIDDNPLLPFDSLAYCYDVDEIWLKLVDQQGGQEAVGTPPFTIHLDGLSSMTVGLIGIEYGDSINLEGYLPHEYVSGPLQAGTYQIQVSYLADSNGCTLSAASLSYYTFKLTINPQPDVFLELDGNDLLPHDSVAYCYDVNEILLTLVDEQGGNTAIGTPPFSISYTINGGSVITETGVQYDQDFDLLDRIPDGPYPGQTQAGTYEFQVTDFTDANGCQLSSGALPYYHFKVTINPQPDVFLEVDGNSLLPYDSVAYCHDINEIILSLVDEQGGQSAIGTPPFMIEFTVNNGSPNQLTGLNYDDEIDLRDYLPGGPLPLPADPGTYEIQVTDFEDANGCTLVPNAMQYYNFKLTIRPEPDVFFELNGEPLLPLDTVEVCKDIDSLLFTFVQQQGGQVAKGVDPFFISFAVVGGAMGNIPNVHFGDELNLKPWFPQDAQGLTPGIHLLYVTGITDSNGCQIGSGTLSSYYRFYLKVNANPNVSLNLNKTQICNNSSPFILSGGTPTGGVYSGQGVSSGAFYSSLVQPGTYTISYTYTDPEGCIGVATDDIEVLALPNVYFTGDQEACESQSSITLNQGFPSGGTYSGTYVSGGIFDVATAGPGSHSISYAYEDGNGCINTASGLVIVHALPVVTCPPDMDVCVDDAPFALSGASPSKVPFLGGQYSGTGVNSSTGIFDPANAGVGTYTILYTYHDSSGCTDTCTFEITVNDLPMVICPADFSLCADAGPYTLSGATPVGGTYSGTGVSNGNFYASVSGVGTFTITYTYTAQNGCSNSCDFEITVNPLPVPTAGPDTTVCPGQCVDLVATGGISYDWSNGAFSATTQVCPTATTTYTVTAYNSYACSATAQVTVSTYPAPMVSAGADQEVCDGEDADLTATAAVSYVWSTTASGAAITVSPASTTTYTVTGTGANGCTASDDVVVTVNPLPTIVTGADVSICYGECTDLTATGAVSFDWGAAGTGSPLNVCPESTTTFTVTGTDAKGCQNTDQHVVTVLALPVVNAGPDTNVQIGLSHTFTATASGAAPLSYKWTPALALDDATILNPTATPINTDMYTLEVEDANGCVNTDQALLEVLPTGNSISGQVLYANDPPVPLVGFEVVINSLSSKYSDTVYTGANGFFSLINIPTGTYEVKGSSSQPWSWGGVNATDALGTAMHTIEKDTLFGIYFLAGDVDAGGYVNATDAVNIARRFTGYTHNFVGDWVMEKDTVVLGYNQLFSRVFYALVLGDVNASYHPNIKSLPKGELLLTTSMDISAGQEATLGLSIEQEINAGALSLELIIPDGLRVSGVDKAENIGGALTYNVIGNQLRIAWYDQAGYTLAAGSELLSINVLRLSDDPINNFKLGDVLELATRSSEVVPSAKLGLPSIGDPGEGSLSLYNHPNPFSDHTSLVYQLPERGQVELELFSVDGSLVRVIHSGEQEAGTHELDLDAKDLPAGTYYCQLRFEQGGISLQKVVKMVIVK